MHLCRLHTGPSGDLGSQQQVTLSLVSASAWPVAIKHMTDFGNCILCSRFAWSSGSASQWGVERCNSASRACRGPARVHFGKSYLWPCQGHNPQGGKRVFTLYARKLTWVALVICQRSRHTSTFTGTLYCTDLNNVTCSWQMHH